MTHSFDKAGPDARMTDVPTQVWALLVLGTPYLIGIIVVLIVQGIRQLRRIWRAWRTPNTVTEPSQPVDAVASVFLVHGTFARNAAWTLPGSALRETVARAVDGPVAFHNILWSGRNSVTARRAACDALYEALTRSLNQHPERPHFVIAHSHGGNIAMQALSRSFHMGQHCRLICLSTPFLVLRPRPPDPLLQISNFLAPFLLSVLALRALNLWLSPAIPGWWDLPLLLGALAVSALLALVAFGAGERIARDLAEDARIPVVPRRNVLPLRTIADEASMGIAAVNLISRATQMILFVPLSLLSSADETVEKARSDVAHDGWAFLWGAILLFAVFYWVSNSAWAETSQIATVLLFVLLAAAALLFFIYLFALGVQVFVVTAAVFAISVALAPILAPLSLLAMATGREMALANPHVEFFAEPAPVGDWNLVIIREYDTYADRQKVAKMPALQHSQSYLNPGALYTIQRWISDRSAQPRVSDPDRQMTEFRPPNA